MKDIKYLEILKRALKMTWNNKFLWLFGLFIFLGSLASNANFNMNSISEKSKEFGIMSAFIQDNPVIFGILFFVLSLMLAVLFFLKFIGIAGVIKSTNNIAVYSQSKIVAIFSEVKKHVWMLLLLDILIGVVLLIILIVLFVPVAYLYTTKEYGFFVVSLIVACAIGLFLFVTGYYLRQYAYFYIVLGNMKIRMALEAAYSLLQKNIKASLTMGCLVIATLIGAIVIATIAVMFLIFITAPAAMLAYFMFAKTGAIVVMTASAISGIVIVLIFFSWYASFAQTIWVLFFQEISFEKQGEKKYETELESPKELPNPEIV